MTQLIHFYKRVAEKADLPFLLFLLTISSNKIYLKVVALLLIFALRPKFNFMFNKKLPYFYPLIAILATVQFLFFGRDFSLPHFVAFGVGLLYWLICYAYMYQSYLFTKQNSMARIDQTLKIYVILNFAMCLFNYVSICIKTNSPFPFFLGEGTYGPSTGDHITGLFGHPSYINAIVNALFALYYIHHKKMGLFLLTTFCALLSFANVINLVFIGILIVYLFIAGDNRKRVFIVINLAICVVMYLFVSPDNYIYVKKTIGLSVGNETEIMPQVITSKFRDERFAKVPARVSYVNDSSAARQQIMMFDRSFFFHRSFDEYRSYAPADIKSSPGKKIAIMQTIGFVKANPVAAMFGAGMGNFSSRLAFQFSGRDSSRLFSHLPKYCSGYYFQNNLLIYDHMIMLPNEYHSIKHFPNNFFSQLLGEYGIIGVLLFLLFYLWFFYKRVNSRLFFFLLLSCVGCYLMLEYLYEFFNVMTIFELLLFIDCKQKQDKDLAPVA